MLVAVAAPLEDTETCWLNVLVAVLLRVEVSEALPLDGCVALGVSESEDVCVMTMETLWEGLRVWLAVSDCVWEGPCDALAVTVALAVRS